MTEVVAPLRRWPVLEVVIVLGLGLGKSMVYSILELVNKLTQPVQLGEQTTQLNTAVVQERPWLDLAYQLAGITFPLFSALLALYLVHLAHGHARRTLGFDMARPVRDFGWGALLAASVGIPGIAFYLAALHLGFNTRVEPSNLSTVWWTIPIYLGFAAAHAVVEEVVMVGYLVTRLRDAGWAIAATIAVSSLIRGGYHLYQGFGGGAGNILMGLIFCCFYLKTRRVAPLVWAHFLMDAVVFVGYPLAYQRLAFLH
ncbi:MAG: CPBP family intramembrane glutamic endopeptidase [Propionibacteriaceae bacterium]